MIKSSSAKKASSVLYVSPLLLYSLIRKICQTIKLPMLRQVSIISLFSLLSVAFSAHATDQSACKNQDSACLSKRSVADVIKKISPRVENRLRTFFDKAGVSYPPSRLTLIGLKDEMELEVWAERDGRWVYIVTYDVLAASGDIGPKQKAGDRQVPEGIYRISTLNPNSNFHLSIGLDYPNEYDRMKAHEDGRSNLGGDIYIHGKAKSKGCIAMGDSAIEELFVLAARTGIENTQVLIAPYDFRNRTPASGRLKPGPAWLPELYQIIGQELQSYKAREGDWPRSISN